MFWIHFTGYDVKNILNYHGIPLDKHVFYSGTLPDYKMPVSYTHLDVYKRQPLIVPPWQIRARKSKFQFLSGARARKFSTLHLRLVAY